jgi:hypothetical protein
MYCHSDHVILLLGTAKKRRFAAWISTTVCETAYGADHQVVFGLSLHQERQNSLTKSATIRVARYIHLEIPFNYFSQ